MSSHCPMRGLIVVVMALVVGCAGNNLGKSKTASLRDLKSGARVAIVLNGVPVTAEASANYGGASTLDIFLAPDAADTVRDDFISVVGNRQLFEVVRTPTEPVAHNGCNGELDGAVATWDVDAVLCIERSMYYNGMTGATLARAYLGLTAPNGDLLWSTSLTTGIADAAPDGGSDLYETARRAAIKANQLALARLATDIQKSN